MSAPFQHQSGKEWLVHDIRLLFGPDFHSHEFYDLFCGGLNLSLGLKNPQTTAIDKNPYLIGFYRLLQRGVYFDPEKSLIWTSNVEVPFQYGPDAYVSYIERWNGIRRELSDETLIIFYLLNQMSFKRIMRFSGTGDFNLPFGKNREEVVRRRLLELSAFVYKFQGWSFYSQDALAYPIPPDAAVYADPPYGGGYSNYNKRRWSSGDRELIASRFERHPGPVIISDNISAADIYTDRGYSVRKVINNSTVELIAGRNLPEDAMSKLLRVSHLQTTSAIV